MSRWMIPRRCTIARAPASLATNSAARRGVIGSLGAWSSRLLGRGRTPSPGRAAIVEVEVVDLQEVGVLSRAINAGPPDKRGVLVVADRLAAQLEDHVLAQLGVDDQVDVPLGASVELFDDLVPADGARAARPSLGAICGPRPRRPAPKVPRFAVSSGSDVQSRVVSPPDGWPSGCNAGSGTVEAALNPLLRAWRTSARSARSRSRRARQSGHPPRCCSTTSASGSPVTSFSNSASSGQVGIAEVIVAFPLELDAAAPDLFQDTRGVDKDVVGRDPQLGGDRRGWTVLDQPTREARPGRQ